MGARKVFVLASAEGEGSKSYFTRLHRCNLLRFLNEQAIVNAGGRRAAGPPTSRWSVDGNKTKAGLYFFVHILSQLSGVMCQGAARNCSTGTGCKWFLIGLQSNVIQTQ